MTKKALVLFLLVCLAISPGPASAGQGASDRIIRLHVKANSDAPEDQELKMKVRDAVLEACGAVLADNPPDVERALCLATGFIRAAAQEAVRENGYDYPVTVTMGEADFPTRMYGGKIYAAGRYRSLQVFIGEGAGQNWWCVLFPPLCFLETSEGKIPVANTGNYIPPRPRSRLLEWLRSLRSKAGLICR